MQYKKQYLWIKAGVKNTNFLSKSLILQSQKESLFFMWTVLVLFCNICGNGGQ
jgi:hypothetical protein